MDESFTVFPLCNTDLEEAYSIWDVTSSLAIGNTIDYLVVLQRYLERNPGLSFIARDKGTGRMVATLVGGTDGLYGTLRHAVVIPEYRGLGIMQKLIEQTLAGLRRYGVGEAALYVFSDNQLGLEYFLKSGWRKLEKVQVLVKTV